MAKQGTQKTQDINYQDLKARFEQEVRKGLSDVQKGEENSSDYTVFRDSFLPTHHSLYETACNICEKYVKIKPDEKMKRN